jgi:predicted RNA-binding protein with PUA-like domain
VRYWLLKSEPDSFSIDDLAQQSGQRTVWDGVRNFQARNFIRDEIRLGDHAFFYHSSCAVPGVAGVVEIASSPYPDPTQFDPSSSYHDAKSSLVEPRWFVVDIRLERKLERLISLADLKKYANRELRDFALLRRGNRLSVLPVTVEQWHFVCSLE